MATSTNAPAKALTYVHPDKLKPYARNARVHSKKQIRRLCCKNREA